LDGEEPGFVENVNTVSTTRFLNNAFGQGLLATPLQVAAGYAALVNGGYYIKPTIVDGLYDQENREFQANTKKIVRQIFKPEIAEKIKEALFKVVDNTVIKKFSYIPGFTLGGKS
jgi:cell division protein FtsI/penicillin-binding protein 2